MKQNERESIAIAWNEIEEASESLSTLTDEEIIDCKEAIVERLRTAMAHIEDFFTEEDLGRSYD